MEFWINFWTWFFIVSIIIFCGLSVVVAIGGYFNIRSMFKDMLKKKTQSGDGIHNGE